MNVKHTTFLSLGSNLGNRLENLQNAINAIGKKVGLVEQISSVYQTDAWGFKGEAFYNICIKVSTRFKARKLLQLLLEIEQTNGRERIEGATSYSNRSIDIDILLFDDAIIHEENLQVPHPKMLERNFVLVPLAEIAATEFHPTTKKTIQELCDVCADNGTITKTTEKLVIPKNLSNKYNFIAIEGNIGAGKTSLTNLIAEDFNAKLVLERFADNPFLPKFYKDKDRYAFPLEMSFLADRYQQLTDDLAQLDLFKNFIVSDYYIFKSLIFAQITLQKMEFTLYRRMFDMMYKEITKPDLYVYLYQNSDRLLANIKKRGRSYEQNIEADYLQNIHDGYKSFIATQQNLNTLIIDVSDLDFVENNEDYLKIIELINNA